MSAAENKILVIDDDAFTAKLIGMAIESAGFDVVLAKGAMDALEKIFADPLIGIIISDMNMPLITGVQFFEKLRQYAFHQPFVLLTGDDAAALRCEHPDIDAVIAKDKDFQETLPRLIKTLIAKQTGKEVA